MGKSSQNYQWAGVVALAAALTACSGDQYESVNVVGQTYEHRYGVSVPEEYWRSAGEDGAVVSTLSDGVVVRNCYSMGRLHGETTHSYPHSSQVQKSEVYENGVVAKETEYYYDGTPKTETKYNTPEEAHTTVTTWYLGGTPRSVETYKGDQLLKGEYYTAANQRDALVEDSQGTRLLRDDYGQLLSTDTIEGGVLAQRTTYYPNGSPREIIPYKNGSVEGTKRTFNPSGDPCSVEEWVSGVQEGMTVTYQHGEKYAETPYQNGQKHGVEVRYRDGSRKSQEISWRAGEKHGPSSTYVGDTAKTDWYYQGQPSSKAEFDFKTNKPAVH